MFTPIATILGAALLLLSSGTLLHNNSQILGCSSILSSLIHPTLGTAPTLFGILASPLAITYLAPSYLPTYPPSTWPAHLTAALLVGFGTKWAGGCTSGHMLLGLSRGSLRSLVATVTLLSTAVLTAYLTSSPPSCVGGPCYTPAYPPSSVAGAMVLLAAAGAYILRRLPGTENSRTATRVYSGFVFGLGLLVSGMAAPEKALGFMSVFDLERFDPSLLFVAIVGIGGNAMAWWMRRAEGPALEEGGWCVPYGRLCEWRLVVGSALFGVGWGLEGICPGSAIVAAVLNGWKGVGWVGVFLGGRIAAGML